MSETKQKTSGLKTSDSLKVNAASSNKTNTSTSITSNSSSSPPSKPLTRLQREIKFLTINKNILPNGKFKVPAEKIPDKIKNMPHFNIANYINQNDYRAAVTMAHFNIKQQDKARGQKAARKRKNRRKSHNKQLHTNYILPGVRETYPMINVPSKIMYMRQVHQTIYTTNSAVRPQVQEQSNQEQNPDSTSFTILGKVGDSQIKLLFDSGSSGNNIPQDIYEKLKHFGKFIPPTIFTQDIITASGDILNCIGTFVVDIWLSDKTCAKDCELSIIQGLAVKKIVIGAITISHMQRQHGWYLGKTFHKYPDCKNFGNNQILPNCTAECADISKCLCINPFSPEGYDIIPYIYENSVECNIIQTHKTGSFPVLNKYENTLPERLLSMEYTKIPPQTATVIKTKSEQQSWNPETKSFNFSSKNNDVDDDNLRYWEPSDEICHSLNMNSKEDAKVLRLTDNKCLLINRSDEPVEIHPKNNLGHLYALEVGKRVREIELKHLDEFRTEKIQEKIDKHAPGGISFPKPSGELMFDSSYQRSLARHYGYEPSKGEELSSDIPKSTQPPIKLTHVDKHHKVHNFEIECGLKSEYLRKKLTNFLQKRSRVFFSNPDNHPPLIDKNGKVIRHSLQLKEQALLKSAKPIDLSPPMRKQLHKMIQAKIKNGTMVEIDPNNRGPFNSAVLIVDKLPGPNGEARFRIVQSLLNLNDNTIYQRFSLRSPTEIIKELPTDAQFFSQFDAKDAFDSLALKENEVPYTNLVYRDDKDIPHTVANTRCPQGAVNSPASLINTYNSLFEDLITDKTVYWYFDDAISASRDESELVEKTCKIVDRCYKHNIVLSANKCRICVPIVVFGGYRLEANKSSIPLKYAQRIVDFKRPNDVSSLMNFLGICCFIKQYVRNYAHYSSVLSNLISECTRKHGEGWNWTEECQTAFERLKEAVMNPLSLSSIDYKSKNTKLHVFTDASNTTLGGCLVQEFKDHKPNASFVLIDYFSKTLPKVQRKNGIFSSEKDALMSAVDRWEKYFINPDMPVCFHIDNKILFSMTKSTARQPKVNAFLNNMLSSYRPAEIKWISSAIHPADCLTRLVQHKSEEEQDNSSKKMLKIFYMQTVDDNFRQAEEEFRLQPQLFSMVKKLKQITSDCYTMTRAQKIRQRQALEEDNEYEYLRIFPTGQTDKKGDEPVPALAGEGPERIADDVPDEELPVINRPPGEQYDNSRERVQAEMLNAMADSPNDPVEQAKQAHSRFHLSPKILQNTFKISVKVSTDIVKSCHRCSQFIEPNSHPQVRERKHFTPLSPNVQIAIDIAHFEEKYGKKFLLIGKDVCSGFHFLYALRDLTTNSVFKALLNYATFFGWPQEFRCDNSLSFYSTEMKQLLASHHVLLRPFASYHSNGNAKIERSIRSLRLYLNRLGKPWSKPETIYQATQYLNCFTGLKDDSVNGKRPNLASPSEIQLSYKPDILRLLKLSKPSSEHYNLPSKFNAKRYAQKQNEGIENRSVRNKLKYQVGSHVHYKKSGPKDSTPLPGVIEKIYEEQATIRCPNGLLISRSHADILC